MKELKLPHRQRGIFGLFEDEEKTTTTSEQTKTESIFSQTKREVLAEEEEKTTTELLSEEVRLSVEDLILSISGDDKDAAADISNIASILLGRAEGAEAAIGEANAALIDRARFEGTREIERLTAGLARGAGGGPASNSFVAGATAEAAGALEVGLAGLGAELSIGARGIGTQEFIGAAQTFATGAAAGAAESNALAQLVEVIKGAKATSETAGTKKITEEQTIDQLINALITGTSTTEIESTEGLFGQFTSFLSAANK